MPSRPLALLVLLIACMAALARAADTRADDTATTTPTRIISCAPNLTQITFALGEGDRLIGVTRYCKFPPEAAALPAHGDLYEPNLEAMLAARPDAVLVYATNEKVTRFFARHTAVRVVATNSCDTLAQIGETILQVGRALGRENEAAALVDRERTALDAMRARHAGKPPRRVLMVLSRGEGNLRQLYAVGTGTFLTELLGIAGGSNVLDGVVADRYPQLTAEALVGLAPDVILEFGHPADTPERRAEMHRAWAAMPFLPAVRDGRIAIITDAHLMLPGVDLARDAELLADAVWGPEPAP